MSSSRTFYRFLSLALSVSIVGTFFSPMANAAQGEFEKGTPTKKLVADIGEIPNKLPKSKLELTSKRTKYSTRYLNPDGSFTEEIFADPHFYQELTDKKWKKIDNTLKSSAKDPGKHENTASEFHTTFADDAGPGDLVSIEKGDKSVSFVPVGGQSVKGVVKNNEMAYTGIFPHTDAQYQVVGNKVKEDLVLHDATVNKFSYELKLKGLKPHVEKDGTITLVDSHGQKVWYFEKPFMTDASGKFSDKVKLSLREDQGKTFVDVEADPTFLKDPTTKFPVMIDPTVNNWDVQRDTFISSANPTTSYSSNTSMETGYDSAFGSTRSLVEFYLPSLPSDSKITNASFLAYQSKADTTNASVDLYRVKSAWTGSTTWNSQPTVGTTPESTVTSNTSSAYWQWNITQLMKDWYSGAQSNYGLMLKQQNEGTSPYRAFNTVNSPTNTPQISIDYTIDGIGLEDYWGYSKDGVNVSNGNLVFQDTDVAIPGRGIPVSVSRTYNSRKSSEAGILGYGWVTNLEPHLIDPGTGPITFIDGDGTHHVFGQNPSGGYIAAGGVYLNLVKNADGTYVITQMDGTKINFYSDGWINNIVDTNGNTLTFTYDTAGNLTTLTDPTGRKTTFTYGTNGYVSSITDPASHTVNYSYDANGNLTTVTDAAGNSTTMTYDSSHNLTGMTNSRNFTTTIGYDTSDRVASISKPITINVTQQTSTTTYSYDTTNLVTSVTDGEGKRIDYTYNASGNVVQVTENPLDAANKAITYYAYSNNNELTQVKDANTNQAGGNETYVYTYDNNGNITGAQAPLGQTSNFNYDGQNNLVKETDPLNNASQFNYDGKNNQTESIDPIMQSSADRYYSSGVVEYSTLPLSAADNLVTNSGFEQGTGTWPDHWTQATQSGTTATYAWSSTSKYGNKAISISNPTGWAIASSDQMIPYVSGNQYIVSGYVKTDNVTNTAIVKVEYFDATGNWLGEQQAYQLKGTHDWTRIQAVIDSPPTNTDHMRVSVGLNAGTGTAYFDGVQLEKGTVLSAYNFVENSSFERNLDSWSGSSNLSANDGVDATTGYTGTHSYKMTGESLKNKYITQHINIYGDATTPLTLSGWTKQSGADPNGGEYSLKVGVNYNDGTVGWFSNYFSKTASDWQHVAAKINPTQAFNSIDVYYCYYNQTGTAWFDAMRLQTGSVVTNYTYESTGNYVSQVTDPLGNSISWAYDGVGNKTNVTDAKGIQTAFTYDANNRLTKVTDPNLNATSYGYDGEGSRTSVTDANNHQTTYSYNEWNQIASITNPLNHVIQFGYDKNGNSSKIIFPKGDSVSYTYNGLNRMDGIYYNGVKQWGLAYDPNGNLTSVSDSSGKTTTFTYDKNNQVTEMAEGSSNKIDYVYDNNGRPTSLTVTAGIEPSIATGYTYNSMNQVTALSRNQVNQAKFIYDERGNIISETKGNGTYVSIEYDDANRIKSVKNYDNAGSVLDSFTYTYDADGNRTSVTTNAGTISYLYDNLNQLTKETLADGTTITYAYDPVGNRTSKTVTNGTTTTTNYTYDIANRLSAVNGQVYTYDTNGNLTSNGSKTFVYDVENHLTQVKDSTGASIASFTYDQYGKRLSMTTSTGTIYFHYSGNKVIYETDSNNNIVADYTWDSHGNPITITKGGVTYYYHLNGHGDVTELTDSNGNIVAQYQYDSFGNITSQTGAMASSNPYRYAGYRYDEVTGLYYLMARYYDASTGRFITEDTYKGQEDDPLSLNNYTYVQNSPLNNTDNTGNWCVSAETKWGYPLWSHPGKCTNPNNNKWYTYDVTHDGEAIIANGRTIGYYFYGDSNDSVSMDEVSDSILSLVMGNWRSMMLQFFAKDIAKGISKSMLEGNRVRIELFQNGKYGRWRLEKDRAINSGAGTHGGSHWKLKLGDKGSSYWTLDKDGNVLRFHQ